SDPESIDFEYEIGRTRVAGAEGFEPSALGFGVVSHRSVEVDRGRRRIRTVARSRRQSVGLVLWLGSTTARFVRWLGAPAARGEAPVASGAGPGPSHRSSARDPCLAVPES